MFTSLSWTCQSHCPHQSRCIKDALWIWPCFFFSLTLCHSIAQCLVFSTFLFSLASWAGPVLFPCRPFFSPYPIFDFPLLSDNVFESFSWHLSGLIEEASLSTFVSTQPCSCYRQRSSQRAALAPSLVWLPSGGGGLLQRSSSSQHLVPGI